ncbi:uncharacterized protein [Zea mays]|nr:uncharacterized protein LOC103650896 isoform X2 [Zea mays]|eukprot:XP_008674710.1 uncharacterized protein LOC103650897 isoform X2 [Zea mays]
MVQSLKGILADRSEGEIYATLCDCGMDPDIAVERLISQTPAQLRWSLTKQEWLLATGLTGLLNPYGLWSPRHSQSDVSSSEMEFGTARQYDTTDLDEALQRESFEALNPRAVAVVIDPIQKRTIDFRFWLLNPYGLWSPRHSQSDVSSSEMEFGTARQYDTTDLDEALQREQTHLIDVLCGYHALFAWVPPPLRGLYIEPPTCPTPCRHRVVSGASVASNPNKEELRPDMGGRVVSGSAEHPPVVSSFPINQWLSKEADGKKIQIQLTGFMEKNTVKFMKELWSLLLSAQQNASGVPQQFLDEKEAEIHQKKDDRSAQEIQKKPEKEGMDSELEKNKTMDGDVGNSRSYGDPVASALNSTNFNIEEEKDNDFKRTSRPKNRL